jgi:hypothetical protein
MPPSKALWQAVATVALPSFIFWSIAAIVLRETFDSDALLLYLILFALPLPLIYPIYRRYRKGAQFGGVARSPRYHRTVGVLYLLIAAAYSSPFLVSPKSWGLISPSSHGTVLGRTCSKSIPSCDQGGNALTLSRRPPPASALMTRSYGLFAALAPI